MNAFELVRPGDNAEFFCTVDANPINADTVKWTRDGFDFDARSVLTFSNVTNSVYLVVKNVTGEDSGEFFCTANNGIGTEVKNSTFLLVRRKTIRNGSFFSSRTIF